MNTRALSRTAGTNESEDKFTHYTNVVSLKEMAFYRISVEIWLDYISGFKPNDFKKDPYDGSGDLCNLAFGLDFKYWHDTWAWAGALELPNSLEEILCECNDDVVNETRNWLEYFRFYIMRSEQLKRYLIKHFDMEWCVWSPEGKIDYKKTAAKMVASLGSSNKNKSGLTREQKFAIMSNFCMEDEIKTFPAPSKKFIQLLSFEEDPLIFYWSCYRREALHEVPLGTYNSVDFVMALRCCYKTWPAFEYFWNRLNAEDQYTAAKHRLLVTPIGQEQLLSKMCWSQQLRLIREIPAKIIENFWSDLRLPEPVLWALKHTQDLLTAEEFAKIVMKIFSSDPNESEMRLLLEIWDKAPIHFKKHIAENEDDAVAKYISYYLSEGPSNGKEFVFRFLSSKQKKSKEDFILKNAAKFAARVKDLQFVKKLIELCLQSSNSKKSFILKNAIDFAVHVTDVQFVENLMESCLQSPQDRSNLKKSIMDSKEMMDHCEQLFGRGDFENLQSKIKFYSLNMDSEREFKQRLLNSKCESFCYYLSQFITDFEKWTMLSDFVNEAFPNDESSALSLKKQFVLSYAINLNENEGWNCQINGTIKVVESLFQDKELGNIKRLLSNCFKNVSTSRETRWSFRRKEFREFVSWCFSNDEKALIDFKSAAPLDAIFDEILEELHGVYVEDNYYFVESLLPVLNELLMWLFSDAKEANKYKFRRISSLEELQIFNVLREQNDETNLEILTKWYFNNDEAKIRRFRSKKLKTK